MKDNNILEFQRLERYEKLTKDKKDRLDEFYNKKISDYQLLIIKKKRIYPQIGDIFELMPSSELVLKGVVLKNHINNINGDDLIVICIFKEGIDIKNRISIGIQSEDLLIPPQIVGKEYWSRGYFYNVDQCRDKIQIDSYGFYEVGIGKKAGRIVNEFGEDLVLKPKILGLFAVCTGYGIGWKINEELLFL